MWSEFKGFWDDKRKIYRMFRRLRCKLRNTSTVVKGKQTLKQMNAKLGINF